MRGTLTGGELESLVGSVSRDGVEVEFASLGGVQAGSIRNAVRSYHCIGIGPVRDDRLEGEPDAAGNPVFAKIVLNRNLSEEALFATLTHELGHLYCGHVGTPDPKRWPDRTSLDRDSRELEAECVSYLVCGRLDIATNADKYLAGYLGENGAVPNISIDRVFKAAQRIEAMLKRGGTIEQ